jgi:CRISPR/Cas system CMR subunit Cmr6 (Cas7 group RAMP superfamily)
MYIKSAKDSYEYLQALHIEPKNFESFEYSKYALSYIAVLKKTDAGEYEYNFLFSSSIDEMPLYKNENWEGELIFNDALPAPLVK